jgi:hypothetical protein
MIESMEKIVLPCYQSSVLVSMDFQKPGLGL